MPRWKQTLTRDELGRIRTVPRPLEDRFWEKVAKGEGDGCWEWVAARIDTGFGLIGVGKKTELVHRVSWTMEYGAIPDNQNVLHSCKNHACVRPSHLYLGDKNTAKQPKLTITEVQEGQE
jgi:hypothetical protein